MKLKYYSPVITWSILITFLLYQMLVPPSHALAKDGAGNGSIAGIEIDGVKKNDIPALLATEVTKWKELDMIVQGETGKVTIPTNLVNFNIQKTVDQYFAQTAKPWYQFWGGKNNIQIPLEVTIDETVNELLDAAPLFNKDATIQEIKEHAGNLQNSTIRPIEAALTKENLTRIAFEVQDVTINATGIARIVSAMNETTILDGDLFSFIEVLRKAETIYHEETVNFVASVLYSAVLQSELDIQERYSQNKVPSYLQPGIEVKVDAKRGQDFGFINRTGRPVIVYSTLKEGRLLVELYSIKSDQQVTYAVTNKEFVKPRTIYRLTQTLPAGQEMVEQQGENGVRVQVYKKYSGGTFEKDVLISRDFYPPRNKVILVSSLEAQSENNAPVDGSTTSQGDGASTTDGNDTTTPSDPNTTGDNGTITPSNPNTTNGDPDNENDKTEDVIYDKGGNINSNSQ